MSSNDVLKFPHLDYPRLPKVELSAVLAPGGRMKAQRALSSGGFRFAFVSYLHAVIVSTLLLRQGKGIHTKKVPRDRVTS